MLTNLLHVTLAADTTAAETTQKSINWFDMAQYGGWIMIILAILLAGACYIFIERFMAMKRATQEDKKFMAHIRDFIHEGKIDSALNLCKKTDTPSAHMIQTGITNFVSLLDNIMVGRLGTESMSGVSIVNQFIFIFNYFVDFFDIRL